MYTCMENTHKMAMLYFMSYVAIVTIAFASLFISLVFRMYGQVEDQRRNGELFVYLRDKLQMISDEKCQQLMRRILEADLDAAFETASALDGLSTLKVDQNGDRGQQEHIYDISTVVFQQRPTTVQFNPLIRQFETELPSRSVDEQVVHASPLDLPKQHLSSPSINVTSNRTAGENSRLRTAEVVPIQAKTVRWLRRYSWLAVAGVFALVFAVVAINVLYEWKKGINSVVEDAFGDESLCNLL